MLSKSKKDNYIYKKLFYENQNTTNTQICLQDRNNCLDNNVTVYQ